MRILRVSIKGGLELTKGQSELLLNGDDKSVWITTVILWVASKHCLKIEILRIYSVEIHIVQKIFAKNIVPTR
jgi:hypothetical protein